MEALTVDRIEYLFAKGLLTVDEREAELRLANAQAAPRPATAGEIFHANNPGITYVVRHRMAGVTYATVTDEAGVLKLIDECPTDDMLGYTQIGECCKLVAGNRRCRKPTIYLTAEQSGSESGHYHLDWSTLGEDKAATRQHHAVAKHTI